MTITAPIERSTFPGDAASPALLPGRDCALFLDFDGTLVELAEGPDQIRVPSELGPLLERLRQQLGGALAIVTGRAIDTIDHYLQPLQLCVAGVHGAERRNADGSLRRAPVPQLNDAIEPIAALCARHPALRLETKPGAVALHYRQAPELQDECLATMQSALERVEGLALLRGKMVVELKPSRVNKATAVAAFMERSPFRSRRPWFLGDDVTDESAFEYVQSVGGVAVRVGPGETLAAQRLADPAAVRQWLQAIVEAP
ncbi:MAG: trehalose-phosphatase [Rhizobacter sp.]